MAAIVPRVTTELGLKYNMLQERNLPEIHTLLTTGCIQYTTKFTGLYNKYFTGF